MSNTTVTNAIRTALKVAGFNARQVSVKDRSYGDIKVTVRDVTVALSKVEAICTAFESVRRCESSGEILLGGNTYMEVRYHDDLLAPVTAAVAAIIRSTEPGVQVQLAGGYTASRYADSPWRDEVRAHGPGFDGDIGLIAVGIDHAAKQIAAKYLDTRARARDRAGGDGGRVTDDKRRKRAIRERMAQTGESYTQAMRALDAAPRPPSWERISADGSGTDIVRIFWTDDAGVARDSTVRVEYDIGGAMFFPHVGDLPDEDTLSDIDHDMTLAAGGFRPKLRRTTTSPTTTEEA